MNLVEVVDFCNSFLWFWIRLRFDVRIWIWIRIRIRIRAGRESIVWRRSRRLFGSIRLVSDSDLGKEMVQNGAKVFQGLRVGHVRIGERVALAESFVEQVAAVTAQSHGREVVELWGGAAHDCHVLSDLSVTVTDKSKRLGREREREERERENMCGFGFEWQRICVFICRI